MKNVSVEITNKMQPCNRTYHSNVHWRLNMFRAAHRSSSGAPNCICSLWFTYACGNRPLSILSGNSTQTWQQPVTTRVYKPEAANTVWSSWWWAVCRSKRDEPSMNVGMIGSVTGLHLVGYFYWFILRCTDPWIKKKIKMCIGLHVKYPLFLSGFNVTWFFSRGFRKIFKYKISWKSMQLEPSCSMRTDGRTRRSWQSFFEILWTRLRTAKRMVLLQQWLEGVQVVLLER
jgi:hypothetical protein